MMMMMAVVVVMMMMMVDRNYIKKPLRSSRQTSIRPWSAAYITAFFPAYKRFLKSRVWISLWQRRSLSTWFSWSMLMPGAAISCSTTSRWPYLAIMCIRIGIECPTSTISQYISQFHQPTCCWKWGREPVYQYIRLPKTRRWSSSPCCPHECSPPPRHCSVHFCSRTLKEGRDHACVTFKVRHNFLHGNHHHYIW